MKKKIFYVIQITLLIIFVANIMDNYRIKQVVNLCDSLFEATHIELTVNEKTIVLDKAEVETFKDNSLYPNLVTQYKNKFIFSKLNGNIAFKNERIIAEFTLKKLENYSEVRSKLEFNFDEEYIAIRGNEYYFFRGLTEIIDGQTAE